MRLPFRPAVLALLLALPAPRVHADPVGSHFYLTPFGGMTRVDQDFRTPGGYELADGLNAGARFGWQFHPLVALELAGGFSPVDEQAPGGDLRATFSHGSANVVFSPFAARWLGPFVFAGAGAARIGYGDRIEPAVVGAPHYENFDMGTFDAGVGLHTWLTDRIGIRLEARNLHWLAKDNGGTSLDHVIFGGGISLAIGARPRDTDLDGVPDRKDKCPDTPRGAKVDAAGCPLDSDHDGVFDGLDQCEGTLAGCRVDARGCPTDADGDGVCDGVDQCADTPKGATVDAKGCPSDRDGDGVLDGIDQCAATPKGATVDATGCPVDSDHDGVFDGLDQCPGTAPGLKVDAAGCPIEVSDRETELLDTGRIRIENVQFATAKADIAATDLPRLDVVGRVLQKWPELRIEIDGHTDGRGSRAYNQRLSDARAKAVMNHMLSQFPDLKPAQFTAKGFGEDRPIAPNRNEAGWSRNRRVEFVVLNKDVLKRERERRRLLRIGEATNPDTLYTAPRDSTR